MTSVPFHLGRHIKPDWFRIYRGAPSPVDSPFVTHHLSCWFLEQGQVTLRTPTLKQEIDAGHFILILPGEREQRFSPDAVILSLNFAYEWNNGLQVFIGPQIHSTPISTTKELYLAAESLLEWTVRMEPADVFENSEQAIELQDLYEWQRREVQWLQHLLRTSTQIGASQQGPAPNSQHLRILLEELQRWPLDQPFDAKVYSENTGVSTSQLHRTFMKHFDKTPRKMFEQRRAVFACRELQRPGSQIKATAYALGFTSMPQFSNWFRRLHGVSPREYRNQLYSKNLV